MSDKNQLLLKILFFCLLSLFFINFSSGEEEAFVSNLSNALHFPFFIIFSFILLQIYRYQKVSFRLAQFNTFYQLVFLAILIEIIQPYFGRSQSFRDLIIGVVGVIFSFPLFKATNNMYRRKNLRNLFFFIFLSLAIFIVFLIPSIKGAYLNLDQKRSFPNLLIGATYGLDICGEGDRPSYKKFFDPEYFAWQAIDHEVICWQTLKGLNVETNSDSEFSGVELTTNPQNWSNYQKLNLLILLGKEFENEEAKFNLRIDDDGETNDYNQRFNRNFVLKTGENQITIPLSDLVKSTENRELNLHKIKRVLLFFEKMPKNRSFIISQFFLD